MTICTGSHADHCCYLGGRPCKFLTWNKRWLCGLLVKYGTWEKVYASKEYAEVRITLHKAGYSWYFECGSWPREGEVCAVCGAIGDGKAGAGAGAGAGTEVEA